MASIKVSVNFTIKDGSEITFKAPCNASEVTGFTVYYPNTNGVKVSQSFLFKDAHGNNLADINNLFASGALVKVVLYVTNNDVYIQNADTNAYLEGKFTSLQQSLGNHSQAASTITAGTLAGKVVANASAVTDLTAKQVRNIYAGTTDMEAGVTALTTGDIYIVYE